MGVTAGQFTTTRGVAAVDVAKLTQRVNVVARFIVYFVCAAIKVIMPVMPMKRIGAAQVTRRVARI